MTDLYEELAIDLVQSFGLNMFVARRIVTELVDRDLIDYDALKEHYLNLEE